MYYNIEETEMPKALGITQERAAEITNGVRDSLTSEMTAAEIIEVASKLPNTIEEAFYLGIHVGNFLAKLTETPRVVVMPLAPSIPRPGQN